jgi:hypothetical protein
MAWIIDIVYRGGYKFNNEDVHLTRSIPDQKKGGNFHFHPL